MPTTQSLNITLPLEIIKMVKNKVLSGEYANESEVIRDSLRTLEERDEAVENWLYNEVLQTYDAVMADPSQTVSSEDAWNSISTHMDSRTANKL